MKRKILLSCFLLLTAFTFAQVKKTIDIPVYKNGDTSLWYKWNSQLCDQLKIMKLVDDTSTFHFRFWQNGQAVDLSTSDYRSFQGNIISSIKTYDTDSWKRKKPKPEKVFSSIVKLDTAKARQAYHLLTEFSILSIPTEEKIKGWSQGDDGITYFMESSSPDNYTFKSYWEPTDQKDLPEAKKIQDFVDRINLLLKLKELNSNLTSTLPDGQYSNDGFMILTIHREDEPIGW